MFRSVELEEVRESRERDEEEDGEEIQIRNLYLLRLLSLYDEMNRLSNDNWQSRLRQGPQHAHSEAR